MKTENTALKNTENILIVGLGLIGGSYAKALTKQGFRVRAVTKRQEDIDYAVEHGFLAEGDTAVRTDWLGEADIVVLALYPHTLIDWVTQNGKYLRAGTLVTDVTGVKGSIIETVQNAMPQGVEFIAAHPMAGRERSGVQYSDDSVFHGANYIMVPNGRNSQESICKCEALGEALGFYRISRLDAATHDRMIAFLSQLTHCIAVSLMCASDVPGMEAYTGDSFRDLTRIARINDEMWSELFLLNRDELVRQMDLFSEKFELMRNSIANGDRETIRRMMRLSTERRKYFDVKKEDDES